MPRKVFATALRKGWTAQRSASRVRPEQNRPVSSPPPVKDPQIRKALEAIWPQYEAGVRYLKDR